LAALAALTAAPAAHAQVAVEHDSTVVTEQTGNGNGVPEPGETIALTESVLSVEMDTLTGVSGHLSTTTPDVSVGAADAAWPDLDFAMTAASLTPFTASLAAALPCGVPASFDVALSTSAGPGHVAFTVPTGSRGTFASTDATGLPAAIPDPGTVDTPLTVAGTGRVKGLRVRIGEITHPYVGDLRLTLIAPDGRSVVLVSGRGGAGQNLSGTVFDDAAASSVMTGSAPFTGSFRPEQALATLDGAPLAGTWTLRVTDQSSGQAGSVGAWGLDAAPAVCQPAVTPPPPAPDPDGDDDRLPPGFEHRSPKARGHWPNPAGFVRHASARAHRAHHRRGHR
jgi:subtilisin-like proprotein convertase family protein